MPDELSQADEDAKLVAEAAALGVSSPEVWEAYRKGWENDVLRRINQRFEVDPSEGID